MTLPLTMNETIKRLTLLPIWTQNHSGGNSVVLGITPHPHPTNKLFGFCGRKAIQALATTMNEPLQWLTLLPIWMQNHSTGNSVVLGITLHPHPPNKPFGFCGRKAIQAVGGLKTITIFVFCSWRFARKSHNAHRALSGVIHRCKIKPRTVPSSTKSFYFDPSYRVPSGKLSHQSKKLHS